MNIFNMLKKLIPNKIRIMDILFVSVFCRNATVTGWAHSLASVTSLPDSVAASMDSADKGMLSMLCCGLLLKTGVLYILKDPI